MSGRSPSYRGYQRRYALLVLFFAAYAVVAVAGDRYAPRGEFYPVFSWSLFTYVPDVRGDTEVVVHRVGDRVFDPPVPYTALKDDFAAAGGRAVDAYKAARGLVDSSYTEPEGFDARRRMMEKVLFDGRTDVEYEIRMIAFRPLERWRDGAVLTSKSFGRYTTGERDGP